MSTKERILKAALSLFSRKPFSEVSVSAIAEEAGVSKGVIFHYFKSKADLGRHVLEFFLDTFVARPVKKILSSEKSFEEKIDELLRLSVDFSLKHDIKTVLLLANIYEELRKRGKGWILEEFYRKHIDVFAEFLRKSGVENPEVKAIVLMAVLDGLSFHAMICPDVFRDEARWKAIREEVARMLRGGVQ